MKYMGLFRTCPGSLAWPCPALPCHAVPCREKIRAFSNHAQGSLPNQAKPDPTPPHFARPIHAAHRRKFEPFPFMLRNPCLAGPRRAAPRHAKPRSMKLMPTPSAPCAGRMTTSLARPCSPGALRPSAQRHRRSRAGHGPFPVRGEARS